MKTKALGSFFVLFAIAAGIVTMTAPTAVFADHSEVTVKAAAGSGFSGCQDTPEGCYIPSTATVDVGGVVIFSNTDSAAHTFTSGVAEDADSVGAIFDSGLVITGNSFEWNPTEVGEVPYFCIVHPWMTDTIIVTYSDGSSDPVPSKLPTSKVGEMTDWEQKYFDVLYDFNALSAKAVEIQKENQDLKDKIANMQQTIDNLNTIILEQVKIIHDWVIKN